KNAVAYKRVVNGESLEGLYTTKILEKEMSKAGQNVVDKKAAKAEAIKETLETNVGKMPIFNLIRNLRNILINTPDQVDLVCEIINNREKIIKSRMLPFRFASAYEEVEKIKTSSDVVFENKTKTKILTALENAINLSCENIPKLVGNTAILIDHSGSMTGGSGSSAVSTFSNVTTSKIANLFGCMLMQTQDNVYMGLFGDTLIRVDDIDRTKGILKTHTEVHTKGTGVGGGSEHGLFLFFADIVKHRVRVDNVVIFSDMVIGSNSWYGQGSVDGHSTNSGSFNKLLIEFKAINPQSTIISVNLRQTDGSTVFNKEHGVTQISGWSEKIFDTLNGLSKGYDEIIKEIEAIKL
ncbi:MAG: TROVE domain-containing protein, partial [Candidatus Heimdallarchaeota archaeon]